jgi:hypothetical protein
MIAEHRIVLSTPHARCDALEATLRERQRFDVLRIPRSIQAVEHLARWRGATVGCEAAEAFEIGQRIE